MSTLDNKLNNYQPNQVPKLGNEIPSRCLNLGYSHMGDMINTAKNCIVEAIIIVWLQNWGAYIYHHFL